MSRKLLLKCSYSPGDIVMLTAAVRDLHKCYPNRYLTDIHTSCLDLWENNPYLTPLSEADPEVKTIECKCPLVDQSNDVALHFLHGFIRFLNQRLDLQIGLTACKGDIHLSDQEKAWYSQVHELTGEDTPFWIVAAGGKYDVTVKWWDTERYQAVVDHFRGRIQFVQIGKSGHYHPRLDGVIDLRGQTDLRQLVRLIHHAQGVLCPITAVMHLAAAVESKPGYAANRPCVVIAGGREPAHWEAYPGHQFISTVGTLPCCLRGGCWKDRIYPLGDGDARDKPEKLCVNPVGLSPRCMDAITPQEVIRRIESYFDTGIARYLTRREARAAARGVRATKDNRFDGQKLTVHSVRPASERFIRHLPTRSPRFRGRGIVICGGGARNFTNAWVCISMLRHLGCSLPIQLWHLGAQEFDAGMKELVAPLGVECVDASEVRSKHPVRRLRGWELKPYAILHSPFREVLLLDADNVPVRDPAYLFNEPQFKETGAVFWRDFDRPEPKRQVWQFCGVPFRREPPFESGQILVDKERCWDALALAMWYNEHSDFFYKYIHGDKDTFHLAFRKLDRPFAMPARPIHPLWGTMCQHDFEGRRLFQHRNTDKWNLFLTNRRIRGFRFEKECRQFLEQLRAQWDGRAGHFRARAGHRAHQKAVEIVAAMISCPQRVHVRQGTLSRLARTDWADRPVHVQLDRSRAKDARQRLTETYRQALLHHAESRADYLLVLEDDLGFNMRLLHNLLRWPPLRTGEVTLASLYNPGVKELAYDLERNAIIADPKSVFGSQALLVAIRQIGWYLEHWHEVDGMADIKMPRLTGTLGRPVFFHAPSLVQHMRVKSTWGGWHHTARDFDRRWLAP